MHSSPGSAPDAVASVWLDPIGCHAAPITSFFPWMNAAVSLGDGVMHQYYNIGIG